MANKTVDKKLTGFLICGKYSKNLILIAKTAFRNVSKKFPLAKVALAVYGSASRGEMSAESDADLLIITNNETDVEKKFRELFITLLRASNTYSKVDVPEWGDISYLKSLVEMSLPEGNQVLEAIPLAGDKNVIDELGLLQKQGNTRERALKNLIFQKHCFNEYYRKRQKVGYINVKYSHGGTRDLLFLIYLVKLYALFGKNELGANVSIFEAINYLGSIGLLSEKEKLELLNASSLVMLVRSESLVYNKNTPLANLSFLDLSDEAFLKSSSLVRSIFSNNNDFKENLLKSQNIIFLTKIRLIDQVLEKYLPNNIYKKIKSLEVITMDAETIRNLLIDENLLVRVSALWKIIESKMYEDLKVEISNMIKREDLSWEETASLASISELGEEELNLIAKKVIDISEFGYILRIIAQHPNTPKSVLKDICLKKKDARYTQLAQIALFNKKEETNFQV